MKEVNKVKRLLTKASSGANTIADMRTILKNKPRNRPKLVTISHPFQAHNVLAAIYFCSRHYGVPATVTFNSGDKGDWYTLTARVPKRSAKHFENKLDYIGFASI